MIATIVGRVAVDAGNADSERHESVRQRRVVLTSRCWRQVGGNPTGDGGKRAVLRGEHEISRKTIAQGVPGVPVNLYTRVRSTYDLCTRGRGCSGHPALPCALDL